MFWFILVLAIIGIIIYTKTKSDDAQSSNYSLQDSTSSSTSYSSSSTSYSSSSYDKTDTLEDQHIYYCLPRFCGAIRAIRNAHSYRDNHQGGSYSVTMKDDGSYHIHGFYDHDGDYGLYEALRNGGYLQYYGMTKVEDGVRYEVDGVKPLDDSRWFPPAKRLTAEMKEYFGEDIVITSELQRENFSCVSFRFKGA